MIVDAPGGEGASDASASGEVSPPRSRWGRGVLLLERLLFAGLVSLLVVTSLLPLATRGLDLDLDVSWCDGLGRQTVLWIAIFGAMAATRDRKHITVDVLAHLLPPRGAMIVRGLGLLTAAAITGYLLPAAYSFLASEREFASTTGIFEISSATFAAVVPYGLTLLAIRLAFAGLHDVARGARRPRPTAETA